MKLMSSRFYVFFSELMLNPFTYSMEKGMPLSNIATGLVVPDDMTRDLLDVESLEMKHMNTFIEERLCTKKKKFWDPIPQLKLKTFATLKIKKQYKTKDDKTHVITADRNLFGRLVIVSKSRDIDLRNIMSYKLSTVPFSLAHSDGH